MFKSKNNLNHHLLLFNRLIYKFINISQFKMEDTKMHDIKNFRYITKQQKFLPALIIPLLIIGLFWAVWAFSIVEYNEYAIERELGKLDNKIREPGINYVGIGTLIRVNNQVRNYEIAVDGASSDFQSVDLILNLNLKINKDQVYDFVKDYRTEEMFTQYLNNKVQEKVKLVLLQYNAEKMLTDRDKVREEMYDVVVKIPELKYFTFNDLTIKDIAFSEEFDNMLERRASVNQERVIIEKQKQNLELLKKNIESVNIDTYFKYKLIEKWDGKADLIISDALLTTGKVQAESEE